MWRNWFGRGVAALAVALTPASASLLAAPGAVATSPPIGAAAWQGDPRRLPDPVTTAPATIRRFFAGLSPTEQQALAVAYPGVVGNLDGAPIELRYTANHLATGREHILAYDPRGRGHVAEVVGDLATAERIAVLVPGAGNRLGNFWSGVGGKAFRSPAKQGADLYRAAHQLGPAADRFAVVVWLGYEPPVSVNLDAAREDIARTAAAALERFVTGLAALRPHATVALLGYSYGSTVIGLAARHLPPAVTDLVALGSPGLGADSVAGLGTRARVWAALSKRDPMRFVPGVRLAGLGHGRQPADPAFGARVIPAGDVVDHDHYLADGTTTQAALARIAVLGTDRASAS